jgi:hypothetical protein
MKMTTETLTHDAPVHKAEITMRYSAWSANPEYWERYAPLTLALLEDGFKGGAFEESGETLTIVSRPHFSDIETFTVVFTPKRDVVQAVITVESETDEEYDNVYEMYFIDIPYGTSLEDVLALIDETEAIVIKMIEAT